MVLKPPMDPQPKNTRPMPLPTATPPQIAANSGLFVIVGAGSNGSRRTRSLYFVIQSSTHVPDDLRARAESFMTTLPDQLAALPPADFAALLAGARANLESKPKSIAEKAGRFFSLAFDHEQDWDRNPATLAALDTLTQDELVALIRTVLDPATARQRLVLLNGEAHAPSAATSTFSDREVWKAQRLYQ